VIREFFYSFHNQEINNGEGTYGIAPEVLKELSRVIDAKVEKISGNTAKVCYSGKFRNVVIDFVPSVKVGEYVKIHYGYAVEIIDSL